MKFQKIFRIIIKLVGLPSRQRLPTKFHTLTFTNFHLEKRLQNNLERPKKPKGMDNINKRNTQLVSLDFGFGGAGKKNFLDYMFKPKAFGLLLKYFRGKRNGNQINSDI